ncbi:MAG: PAS domain S-box protein [Methanocalculus sp. MSAO_Arc2]|uniref:PAS domain S-box protein n=1 Tax=Methanocalculus sp. MSAO_Arc2 TaxID=2293855 RepID=UPI000FED6E3C|nr:MAG: PAS domain S-box protein [Methanocalculus sp. MSAO_Arc2]
MSHEPAIPDKILRALRLRPKGMTITNIAKQIGVTRNSVSKHLEILHIGGKVDVSIIGNAKLYSLAHYIPMSDFLCFTKNLILILDSGRRITQVNDQFLDHFQINKDDLIGLHILDADIPIISTQETLDIIEATKTERVGIDLSFCQNQDEFFYTMEVIKTRFEDGEAGVTIVLDNITERKRAELAVRESEEMYRNVVMDQTEFICRFLPDGTHVFVNEAYCRYFGINRENIIGSRFKPALHPDDRERLARLLSSRTPDNPTESIDQRIYMPDGRELWQRWNVRAVFDENGIVREYQSVGRDITEQKNAEAQLRTSEGRLRHIIELLPLAAAIIDPDGNYTFINHRFTEMFGYTLEDIPAGKDWFTLAYPDPSYREEVIAAWKADRSALRPGTARPRKFWVQCRNGDTKLIFFQPVELCEGSEFILYEDITEDRQVYDLLINEIDQLRRE